MLSSRPSIAFWWKQAHRFCTLRRGYIASNHARILGDFFQAERLP